MLEGPAIYPNLDVKDKVLFGQGSNDTTNDDESIVPAKTTPTQDSSYTEPRRSKRETKLPRRFQDKVSLTNYRVVYPIMFYRMLYFVKRLVNVVYEDYDVSFY